MRVTSLAQNALPNELLAAVPRDRTALHSVRAQARPVYWLAGMSVASVIAGVVLLAQGSDGGLSLLVLLAPIFGCLLFFYWSAYREAAHIARHGELVTNAVVKPMQMVLKSREIPTYVVYVPEAGQMKIARIIAPGPFSSQVFVFSIPGPRTRLAVFVPGQGMTAQLAG